MRNKLLSGVLLALLSASVMVVGTIAYLTDGAVSKEIVFNSGRLKIEGTERDGQQRVVLSPKLTKVSGSGEVQENNVTNICPSDILEAQVEVTNSGDIPMYLGGSIIISGDADITPKAGNQKVNLSRYFKIKSLSVKVADDSVSKWDGFSSESGDDLPGSLYDFANLKAYRKICALAPGKKAEIKIKLELDKDLDFAEANTGDTASVVFKFDIKAVQNAEEAKNNM